MFCHSNGQALIWKVNCICYLIERAVDFSRILISKWKFSLGYLSSGKNNQAFRYPPLQCPLKNSTCSQSYLCHYLVQSRARLYSWTFRMSPQCFMLKAKFSFHWQHVFLSVLPLKFVATIFCLCGAIVMGWDGPLQCMSPLGFPALLHRIPSHLWGESMCN